jgi:hypothetical protein
MNRITKSLGAAALAAGIIGGTVAISATSADAAGPSDCRGLLNATQTAMCSSAWKITNMAPMSAGGISSAGYEYCNIKASKGASVAASSIKSRYGWAKGDAISRSAESWYC